VKKYLLLFVFLSLVFLGHYAIAGQAVYGDGIDYWAHLHTWYFDHDLDFTDEFRHQYNPEFNNNYPAFLTPSIQKTHLTPLGKTDNPHPPGTAVLLFPFYVFADLFARLHNGYSDIYQLFTGLAAVGYTIAGVILVRKICFKLTRDNISGNLASFGILLASPLLYYGSYDVLNSHFASFFVSSLFWYILLCLPIRKTRHYFVLGSLIGLAALIRVQDGLLIIPLLLHLYSSHSGSGFKKLMVIIGSILLVNLPLFYQWQLLYGIPLPYLYLSRGHIYRGLTGSLFHPANGLFSRTPLLIISLLGLLFIPFASSGKRGVFLLSSFFLASLVLITFQGGWHDAAYGGRMFISSLPFFAVLLAFLLRKISTRFRPAFSYLLIFFFFLTNVISIFNFVFFEKEVNSGKKTGLEEHTIRKLRQLFPNLKL
jgi:hypothetical protein